jgi:hypothetical protein
MRSKLQWRAMLWKRIQNDEKTRQQPNLLGHRQMKDLQELADQALRDCSRELRAPETGICSDGQHCGVFVHTQACTGSGFAVAS